MERITDIAGFARRFLFTLEASIPELSQHNWLKLAPADTTGHFVNYEIQNSNNRFELPLAIQACHEGLEVGFGLYQNFDYWDYTTEDELFRDVIEWLQLLFSEKLVWNSCWQGEDLVACWFSDPPYNWEFVDASIRKRISRASARSWHCTYDRDFSPNEV